MKDTNTVWIDNEKLNNMALDKIKLEMMSQNDGFKSLRMNRSLNQKGIQKELNRS